MWTTFRVASTPESARAWLASSYDVMMFVSIWFASTLDAANEAFV